MATAVDEAAAYRIEVGRRIGAEWSERLMGMRLEVMETAGQAGTTVLTGELPDQAALLGVLDQLYCLGAPLLRVERLESGESVLTAQHSTDLQ